VLYRPCLENVRVSRLDQVDGQLRELRCRYGRDLYRILYQRSGNLFILLHAIEKRTGLLPQADIDIAKERFEDFRQRMNRRLPGSSSNTGWTRASANSSSPTS
jgi:phage-related protein